MSFLMYYRRLTDMEIIKRMTSKKVKNLIFIDEELQITV